LISHYRSRRACFHWVVGRRCFILGARKLWLYPLGDMCQWGATASIDAIPHLVSGAFRLALFTGSHCIKSLLEGVQTFFQSDRSGRDGECDGKKADGDWRRTAPNLGLRVKKSASKTEKGDDIVNIRDLGWEAILDKGCVLCALKSQFLCVKLHSRFVVLWSGQSLFVCNCMGN